MKLRKYYVIFIVTTVIRIDGKYDIAIRQEELQGGTFMIC